MNLAKIGAFITARRREVGLTQEQVAQHMDVTKAAVSKWERGLSFPDAGLLNSLSVALKCSIADLLNGRFRSEESSNVLQFADTDEAASGDRFGMQEISFDNLSDSVVSPFLFGNNLEHTRNCVHRGISAQMLENRKFVGKPDCMSGCASGWTPLGKHTYFTMEKQAYTRHAEGYHMKRRLECHALNIVSFKGGEACGIAQAGLTVERGKAYVFSLAVQAVSMCRLQIALNSMEGTQLCANFLDIPAGEDFCEFELQLTPDADCENAALSITFDTAGAIAIGAVSLMPADNFHGMRRDVMDRLREMGVRVLRWPGGNFAGEYNWKDGLLPCNMRAPFQSALNLETQPHSMGYDFHEIGTDEFIALCREIGAEPFITLNPTWNTPEESAQWVEYCNGDETTEYGRLRISRGFPQSYNVNFWSLGNEFGYGHMEGGNEPHEYSRLVRQHAEAMLAVTPTLTLCSSGPYPNSDWVTYSARALGDIAPLVSLHHYSLYPKFQHPENYRSEYDAFLGSVSKARGLARRLRADLKDENLRISFDEWNAWYAWYRPESVSDGLFAARMLHMFICEAAISGIDIVCHFEAVNEGAIAVDARSAQLTSMGKMFAVMKHHALGTLLYADEDVVATKKETRITVTLINPSYDTPRQFSVPRHTNMFHGTLFSSDSVLPHSKFSESELSAAQVGDRLQLTLPPHSVAVLFQE